MMDQMAGFERQMTQPSLAPPPTQVKAEELLLWSPHVLTSAFNTVEHRVSEYATVTVKQESEEDSTIVEVDSKQSLGPSSLLFQAAINEVAAQSSSQKIDRSVEPERRFVCPQCRSVFSSNAERIFHFKIVHRGLKPCVNQGNQELMAVEVQSGSLIEDEPVSVKRDRRKQPMHVRADSEQSSETCLSSPSSNAIELIFDEEDGLQDDSEGVSERKKIAIQSGPALKKKRLLPCPQCDRVFSGYSGRSQHIRAVHRMEKPYICPECGQSFTMKHHMEYHVNAHHTGAKPFKCRHCNQSFAQHSSRNYHQQKYH